MTGGRIVGWSNRNTQGNSQKHDRQLYIDNPGSMHFGQTDQPDAVGRDQPAQLQRRPWHHAVGTLSRAG